MRARPPWAWPDRRPQAGFWALIEILIVVIIIVLALSFYLSSTRQTTSVLGGGGAGSGAGSTPGVAIERAKGVQCRNNLEQLRAAIATYQAQFGAFPPDLQSLQTTVPLTCPVGGEPYQYDPSTGQVHCTHQGHESY